jgi:uncharacterized membrane protein YoaK (UPF0700 family)
MPIPLLPTALRGTRHGPLPLVLLALTVVTGLIDAYSYLTLGQVFVANMTGNVIFMGFATAGAAGFSLTASLVALAGFLLGAAVGGRLVHREPAHRGRMLRDALTLHTALVLAAFATAELSGDARFPLIALLALAMGVQNTLARALAVPDLTTTVLTMTLTGLAADSPGTIPAVRTTRRLLSLVALFAGALLGALAVLHGHRSLPLLLALPPLAATTGTAYVLARSNAPWVRPG